MNVGRTFARNGFVTVTISYRLSALKKSFAIYLIIFFTILLLLLSFICFRVLESLGLFSIEINSLWAFVISILLSLLIVIRAYLSQGEEHIKHPNHIEDVAKAFKWVKDNISQYGGDPDSIFLMGHSAGGQLVSLLALEPKYLLYHNISLDSIRGVIGLSGVYNFDRLHKLGYLARWWYLYPLFGEYSDKQILREASPLTYARKTPFNFYLVYTSLDLHLEKDAQELAEALRVFEVEVETRRVNGTHLKSVSVIGAKNDTLSAVLLGWCKKQLEKKNSEVQKEFGV